MAATLKSRVSAVTYIALAIALDLLAKLLKKKKLFWAYSKVVDYFFKKFPNNRASAETVLKVWLYTRTASLTPTQNAVHLYAA